MTPSFIKTAGKKSKSKGPDANFLCNVTDFSVVKKTNNFDSSRTFYVVDKVKFRLTNRSVLFKGWFESKGKTTKHLDWEGLSRNSGPCSHSVSCTFFVPCSLFFNYSGKFVITISFASYFRLRNACFIYSRSFPSSVVFVIWYSLFCPYFLVLYMGLRATLNFRKFKVALNSMYRILLNFVKQFILSCLSKFYNKKNFTVPFLKYKRLKLKLKVFLAGHSVTKIIPTCSPVSGAIFWYHDCSKNW